MNSKAQELLDNILKLEEELIEELKEQEEKFQYTLEGSKVKFEQAAKNAHRRLRTGFIHYFRKSTFRNIASIPIIYPMIVPLALLDLCITIYQHVCFRLYGIPRVERGDYIVLDRHYLRYLNGIEKLNCLYCGYGNGVIAFVTEIISRTEQYWCPIKHARAIAGGQKRYQNYLSYGDGDGYQTKVLKFRDQLRQDPPNTGDENENND